VKINPPEALAVLLARNTPAMIHAANERVTANGHKATRKVTRKTRK
jgi:hypothetical protein